jgi:hypothetical protein
MRIPRHIKMVTFFHFSHGMCFLEAPEDSISDVFL